MSITSLNGLDGDAIIKTLLIFMDILMFKFNITIDTGLKYK